MADVTDERLDAVFAALASSTRRGIIARLARGGATVNELAEPVELSLPAVSRHLKVLERAGLIERSRHAQYRPCVLNPRAIEEVSDWAEQYRPVWETRFDEMTAYLHRTTDPSEPKDNDHE